MSDSLFSLEGTVTVITGAAGQLGVAFTKAILERGGKVAAVSRSIDDEKARSIYGSHADSESLRWAKVDITNHGSIVNGLDEALEPWGVPDYLVNNAGLDTQPSAPPEVSGPFEEFPESVFREVVDVNLVGTFLMTQEVGKRIVNAGKGGSIVNIGSIYGMLSPVQDIYAYKEEETGFPFVKPVAYSASKSGVYNFTRYCATYWAKKGLRVNTLSPSGIGRDTQDKTFVANYTSRIPVGRMATVEDFVGPVIFLLSDASKYMTGANLVVDGGWTAW